MENEPEIVGEESVKARLEKEYAENKKLEAAKAAKEAAKRAAIDAENRRHWLEQEALKRKPTLAEKREATKKKLLRELAEKEKEEEESQLSPIIGKLLKTQQ